MAITTKELLDECKKGLMKPLTENPLVDNALIQKVLTVKGFLLGAGVSETIIDSDVAIGTIVLGVTDLWNLSSGDVKFSQAFYTMAIHLKTKAVTV